MNKSKKKIIITILLTQNLNYNYKNYFFFGNKKNDFFFRNFSTIIIAVYQALLGLLG